MPFGRRKLLPSPGLSRFWGPGGLAGLELADGSNVGVSGVDEARFRFNASTGLLEVSASGAAYTPILTGEAPALVNDTDSGLVGAFPPGQTVKVSDGVTPGGLWVPYDELGVGYPTSLPTLVALGALPSADLPDGATIYVYDPSVMDVYVLDTVGSHVVDGLVVIAAADGGYWVSRLDGRWDDLQGSVGQGSAVGALTYENYRGTAFKMNFFRHDQNDELSFSYQLPHRWRYTTAVRPHLHVVPMVDPPGNRNVLFNGYYAWVAIGGGPIPDVGLWTTFSANLTISPGDAFVHKYAALGEFAPPVTARESTVLLLYMRRNGTDGADTYDTNKVGGTVAANLGLLSADLHYQALKNGTEQEAPTP